MFAKPKIIFVGAFKSATSDGNAGGQLYACRSLLGSPISEHVEWVLVDSTMETVPPPPLKRRLVSAFKRFINFLTEIRRPSTVGALIFTSAQMSFLEKGSMAIIGALLQRHIVLSPRSGLILDDLERSSFMRWFVPFVMRRCDVIVCQSDGWKELYQSITGLDDSRFVVIRNWIDPEPFLDMSPTACEERQTPVSFLYLGWLEKYKGIYDLVEAAVQVRDKIPESRFIICGQGSERIAVEELVANYGLADQFVFPGWVTGKEKFAIISDADVFVLPSHREGLPNALLEAMAAGLAIVSTTVGAIPEVITNGESGVLINPGNSESLAASLVELYQSAEKRQLLGQQARVYAIQNHDVNKVWPRVLAAFEPVLNTSQ